MNPGEARRIIQDQEDELKQLLKKKIVQREAASQIEASMVGPNAFLITGVRRCGKSTLAVQLAQKHNYARVDFDDERLSGITAKDLNNILEAIYSLHGDVEVLVLDEIQMVKGWEMFVARLRDTKKVIVTGSNSSLMSREFGTRLTGRHLDFTLFPFSFREFLAYRGFIFEGTTKSIARLKSNLDEYMEMGGFPEVQIFGTQILKSILNDIILKDIVLRHGIRNERLIFEIARFLLDNTSNEISYNRIKNAFNVPSVHTVADYVKFLEDSFLVNTIERFSQKILTRYTIPRKVYGVDPALAKKDIGKAMENIVYLELRRQGLQISYYADQDYEVDFVTPDELIQVTYASSENEIRNRELRSLKEVSKKIPGKRLTIITYDVEGEIRNGNTRIRIVPIWKYLLEGQMLH